MVGIISSMVMAQVTTASFTDSHSAEPKPGWVNTAPNAENPANRIAAYSGSRK